jgi:NAD+ synthase
MENLNYGLAAKNIRNILKDHIKKSNLQCLVLGVSGGIDSTACALLAKPVCDELGIPLIGSSITIETNKDNEIRRAIDVGSYFCTDFQNLNLTNLYRVIRDELIGAPLQPEFITIDYKVACGNLKARTRMMKLYAIAGLKNGMVLSTDNYTELLAGFWTLHGDVGDFGMIQNLWKTEVYEMCRYIKSNELKDIMASSIVDNCIDAIPTDGLGISNSDLDQLGVESYEEADKIFREYLFNTKNYDCSMDEHPLIQRYLNTEHKRNNPYNISREEILKIAV